MAGDNMGREHDSQELKLAGKSSSSVFFDVSLSKEQGDSMNAKTGVAHFMAVIVPTDPNQLSDEYCASNFGDLEMLLSCANHNGPKLP